MTSEAHIVPLSIVVLNGQLFQAPPSHLGEWPSSYELEIQAGTHLYCPLLYIEPLGDFLKFGQTEPSLGCTLSRNDNNTLSERDVNIFFSLFFLVVLWNDEICGNKQFVMSPLSSSPVSSLETSHL